ncbi:FBOX protein, partial [Geosmithia morbida]
VNHWFHDIVSGIIHRRLLSVASLPHNDLILECYHPAAKTSTPYLSCRYQDTKKQCPGGDLCTGACDNDPTLHDLRGLYSSFRPVLDERQRQILQLRKQRQQWQQQRRESVNSSAPQGDVADTACQDIFLDDGQLFSQLCAVTNVVKAGPRPGLFKSHINVGEGVLRVWRNWLDDMAVSDKAAQTGASSNQILWVDADQTVGVRFRVTPGEVETPPFRTRSADCPPASYKLEYQEVLVRTENLLMAVEQSEVQEDSMANTAVVIMSC